ncbi:MAG TPA: glycosyltransferase family 39 protein [Pseudolabrys sp.]|nr:glycosyltransferase family 39 protein [Pseudolabrys sp.]
MSARANRLFRLHAALTDPARADRTVLVLLAVYWVVWTAYGTMAKAPQGLHPDMTEIVAWSRDLALGYLKHPPFAAWLAAGWFELMPVAEWSYYALAMLMPVAALWIAWRLMGDYLDAEKRVAGLALLTLIPFFNFHALKYNVNTVLLPLWAATTLWFLRSYRTRDMLDATFAGAAAALAMYGKYWSVFLLAGLVVAALIDRRRREYFRSPAPWVTVGVGLLVLAPHLKWLFESHFAPFDYAMTVHGEKSLAIAATSALGYLAGSLGYVALALIIVAAIARLPSVLADAAWPQDGDRRLAAAAFWAPLLLPVVAALAGKTEITSLWSMSAWTLLPVVLLSPSALHLRPVDTRRLLGLAIALPLVMLVASPAIAWFTRDKAQPAEAQGRLLAQEVDRDWRNLTPEPLRFVGGEADLAYAVVTWSADRPRALTDMPMPPATVLRRAGRAIVCFVEDKGCKSKAAELAAVTPGSRVVESTIVRGFFRSLGRPQGYTITLIPPVR